jgi:hypothetical protein
MPLFHTKPQRPQRKPLRKRWLQKNQIKAFCDFFENEVEGFSLRLCVLSERSERV